VAELDGRRLLAEGREAEIYEWGEGRVLRLMRSPEQREAMDRSTAAIVAARSFDVPTPEVFEVVDVDGRPGQIMERIDGVDLFSLVAARPWKLPSLVGTLGAIHADLHRTQIPEGLPSIHDFIRGRFESSSLVPADIADAARGALEDLPTGSSLCHGDYHPGNVLVVDDGVVVIDWTNAARGHSMADVARSRLMLRVGELPPGSPAVVRGLALAGRAAFWRLSVRAYGRAGTLDRPLVDRWEPVRAADRLAEDVEGERDALLATCREGFGLG
jgi:aminoglycoside phosphotransferase (APT) family kinase protein